MENTEQQGTPKYKVEAPKVEHLAQDSKELFSRTTGNSQAILKARENPQLKDLESAPLTMQTAGRYADLETDLGRQAFRDMSPQERTFPDFLSFFTPKPVRRGLAKGYSVVKNTSNNLNQQANATGYDVQAETKKFVEEQ